MVSVIYSTQYEYKFKLIKKAQNLGFKALVITIDAPISGIRNSEQRAGFNLPDGIRAIK